MRFHLAVAADEAFASLGVDMPALPSRIHRPLGLVAAQPMEPCQVAGAYRASGMELRSQSAAVAGSATALHVASLPPLTLLAPDRTLLVFVSSFLSATAPRQLRIAAEGPCLGSRCRCSRLSWRCRHGAAVRGLISIAMQML